MAALYIVRAVLGKTFKPPQKPNKTIAIAGNPLAPRPYGSNPTIFGRLVPSTCVSVGAVADCTRSWQHDDDAGDGDNAGSGD